MSRALYFCLKELGAEEAQAAQVEAIRAERGIPAAEEAAREWNVVMGLLDEMASLLGGQSVTIAEYEELFGLLLRSSDLGHIPQTLDAVVLASAGKMRLDAPDYVFVLGLSEGEFPAAPGETGLLTHADRDALMAQEVELPDCFENRVVREQVCFYKALTAPAKGLWLSWPKGQGQTLCAALEPVVDLLAPAAPVLELPDLAATPADGLDVLGGGWPLTDTERASLTEALCAPGAAEPEGLALLRRMAGRAPRQVSDLEALETLLGRRLRISPSQLEKYYTCRYGYFLQYVLGLRPRRRAELSADQSGTLMHWVLQMALDPHPGPDNPCAGLKPFLDLDDEAMAALAGLLVDEYAKRYLPEDTARFAYLLSRLKKSMAGLLCYLRDEQRQSSFRPVACELKIGPGEDAVRGQTYRLSDGRTVQLIGTVDRADEWIEDDGTRWVRVVDYKTGSKKLGPAGGLLRPRLPDAALPVQPDPGRGRTLHRGRTCGCAVSAGRPGPRDDHPGQGRPDHGIQAGRPRPGRAERSSTPWTPRRRGGICPSASGAVYPAPTRKRNVPTRPSSPASSSIWTTL